LILGKVIKRATDSAKRKRKGICHQKKKRGKGCRGFWAKIRGARLEKSAKLKKGSREEKAKKAG